VENRNKRNYVCKHVRVLVGKEMEGKKDSSKGKCQEDKFMQKKGRILVSNQSNYNSAKMFKILTNFPVFCHWIPFI